VLLQSKLLFGNMGTDLAGNRGYAKARITLAVTQQNQGFKNGKLHDRKYLDAWVQFPTWARNFKLFGASFEFWQRGDLHSRERREVEFTSGLTSLTCIK
jgi:hypothetical protein